MLLDEARCRRAIGEAFPALAITSLRYFAAGWDYELWEINDELLFRFPLRPECAEPLLVEARLLPELAVHISAAVPRPEYVSEGCSAFPLPFFGYQKLTGSPLSEVNLSEGALMRVGRQIGQFLRELHSFPTERAAALGVPMYSTEGWRQFYRDFRALCDRKVSPLLTPIERKRVDSFWADMLDDDANFQFRPSLVHADLGLDHILVDPERGGLSGVIDFGDARVGDPEIDLVGLLPTEASVLAGYGQNTDETFRRRARFYWRVGPFHEVLYGLDIDTREHVDAGLAGIRARIVTPNRPASAGQPRR